MKLVTKEEAVENWPTWEDGTPVKIGERAMSLRGPRTILGIELDGYNYFLWGRLDEPTESNDGRPVFNPPHIIDEGSKRFNAHPVREGEYCDFWHGDDYDAREAESVDIHDIANRIKRVSRLYGYPVLDVIEKALEWF